MKKPKRLLIFTICLILLTITAGSKKVWAFKGLDLLDYPGIEVVNDNGETENIIPADYATLIRPRYNMSYTVVGGDAWRPTDTSAMFPRATINKPGEHYVQLNNAAIYQGNYIDLRINVISTDGTYVKINTLPYNNKNIKENFLEIMTRTDGSKTVIKYEYLKHGTEERVDYSGTWIYRNVNQYKSVAIPYDRIQSVYAYSTSTMKYVNTNMSDLEVFGTNKQYTDSTDKRNIFAILFDTNNGELYQTITSDNYRTMTRYEYVPFTQMELPTPQIVGEATEMPAIEFSAVQDIPLQAQPYFYPRSYALSIKLKDADMLDWDSSTMIVYDANGQSNSTIKNYFDSYKDKENNQLVITTDAATLQSTDFVDNAYEFQIKGKIKKDADLTEYYHDDGYYHIPAYVQYQTNTNASPETSGVAKIKATISAEPVTQYVTQFSNTEGWEGQPVSNFFKDTKGAFPADDLVISKVEQKEFTGLNDSSVKITLKGSQTGIEKEFTVPVKISAERKATIRFEDKEGKKIAEPVEKKGAAGANYDFANEKKRFQTINTFHLKQEVIQ